MKLTIYSTGGYTYEDGPRSCYSGNTWDSIQVVEVVEGEAAYRRYWFIEYARLGAEDRDIIEAVIQDLHVREPFNFKQPRELYRVALARIRAVPELSKECSRCGGTGNYSYNQRYGTTCFKCGGAKRMLPKITKKWLEAVRKHFDTTTNQKEG